MKNNCDLLIKGGSIVHPHPESGVLTSSLGDIAIKDGKIMAINPGPEINANQTLDAKNLTLIPGAIDTQVHFRDPGFPEKEDLKSGTRAAVFGGVTSIFDMPNTNPPTLTAIDINDKISRAHGSAWCHHAFYLGASPVNSARLGEIENIPGVCGIKIFMGSSTGNLVVGSDKNIEEVLQNGHRRIAVHAEDEPRLKERKQIVLDQPGDVKLHPVWRDVESALLATKKIVGMARKFKRNIHVLHVTTAEEIEFLKDCKDVATVEVTPQHLTLSAPECYERLGTLAQMNPPIREARHLEGLWKGIKNGTVDVIGSDHAPHTLAEKNKTYPESPSGMTGVQTILPLMLHHTLSGKLDLFRLVELLCQNPAKIFGIKNKGEIRAGFDADLTLIDLKGERRIENSWIQSKCGWTPYDGMIFKGRVKATLINGKVVMRDDELIGSPHGKLLEFSK